MNESDNHLASELSVKNNYVPGLFEGLLEPFDVGLHHLPVVSFLWQLRVLEEELCAQLGFLRSVVGRAATLDLVVELTILAAAGEVALDPVVLALAALLSALLLRSLIFLCFLLWLAVAVALSWLLLLLGSRLPT